jgi:hypothetical protein
MHIITSQTAGIKTHLAGRDREWFVLIMKVIIVIDVLYGVHLACRFFYGHS